MSSSGLNLESYLIPLDEIIRATGSFSKERRIGDGGFGTVYKGQLSELWQNRIAAVKRKDQNSHQGEHEFRKELEIISQLQHENVISFIGYCDEDEEMIIVYEYALNGTVDHYLKDPSKMSCITWTQRLEICLGAAKGLHYLHSGLGEHKRVIHRNVYAGNILLDGNMVAKISGFGLSVLVEPNNRPQAHGVARNTFYIDPLYQQSGTVNTELDVYPFGVLLFEMLSGMPAYEKKSDDDDQPQFLITLVRRYYDEGLYNLIDHHIRGQMNMRSFNVFKEIAYQCLRWNLEDRPKMDLIIQRIQEALDVQNNGPISRITTRSRESYFIPLQEINLATGNLNRETFIGSGGFGHVYKGKLSQRWQNCTVAIKCLDREGHQGKKEFDTEINLISRFHHPNIIPFVGYCDEQDQMILVYQYAVNGSLDQYLANRNKMGSLTWTQRLKICLGAAKGLDYLHSGLGKHHRVIHRDVKSANILLDENLEAKICDFGLSTEGPRNQDRSEIYTKVAGTNFYMDPIYHGSGIRLLTLP